MALLPVGITSMKYLGKSPGRLLNVFTLLFTSLMLFGCGTTLAPTATGGIDGTAVTTRFNEDILRVGNKIKIEFSGLPLNDQIAPHEEQIKDDGSVTVPYLTNSIPAAGKTTRQLEKEIHDLYVPQYYTRITVTVISLDRYYSVGGQVSRPGLVLYSGDITVIKAIHSAGDFTDFARRTKVQLTRADKKTQVTIDCEKAQTHPELDLPIYPGDTLFVPRRLW
jgi:protein involved in polysaccharide export with SLBB domain